MKKFIRSNATALLVCWMFNQHLVYLILNVFIGNIPSKLCLWGIYLTLYLLAWRNTPGILTRRDTLYISGWILLLVVSVNMLTKEQNEYILLTARTIIVGVYVYFIGKMAALDRNKNFSSVLAWSNVIAVLLLLCILRLTISTGAAEIMYGEDRYRAGTAAGYSQGFGYSLLPQLCTAIFLVLKGWMWQIPCMLGLLYGVVLSGARGPLVCALGAGLLTMITIINLRSWKSWLMIISLTLFGTILIANSSAILSWFLEVFHDLKLSTRTIETLLEGRFTKSDGRVEFFKNSFLGIYEHLFFGTGIYRDRQFLMSLYNAYRPGEVVVTASQGCYSHMILLELPLQFGIFIGSVILVYLAKILLRSYKRSCSNNYVGGGGG